MGKVGTRSRRNQDEFKAYEKRAPSPDNYVSRLFFPVITDQTTGHPALWQFADAKILCYSGSKAGGIITNYQAPFRDQ